MCVRCWAVYIILTVSKQLHKSHNSIHNARLDNSGCELLLFFFSFSDGRPIGLHAQSSGLTVLVHAMTEINKFALYVHISVYKKSPSGLRPEGRISAVPPSFTSERHMQQNIWHIRSNASCPVTWTNRKNLCQILLYIDLTFWVLRLKSYLPWFLS